MSPKNLSFCRLRYFVTVLCGPLMNVLLIVSAWAIAKRWPMNEPLVGAMWILLLTNLFLLAGNLWPMQHWMYQRFNASDGLQLLTMPWRTSQNIEQLHSVWFYLEGLESRERGRPEEASNWFERG
jgi:hypothetical protein